MSANTAINLYLIAVVIALLALLMRSVLELRARQWVRFVVALAAVGAWGFASFVEVWWLAWSNYCESCPDLQADKKTLLVVIGSTCVAIAVSAIAIYRPSARDG